MAQIPAVRGNLKSMMLCTRAISPLKLLLEDDPIYAWRERMLDLFDGEARRSTSFESLPGSD